MSESFWSPEQKVGNYVILSQIGSGGMGVVYKARDNRLGREVALKAVRPNSASPLLHAAFLREARLASSLNHPGIVTIHDIFEFEGAHCIVMEFVSGQPLSAHIRAGGMPVGEALDLALQIGSAVEAAHAQGVVHRDLKPGNIIVRENGQVKILDFGLATISGDFQSGDAQTTLFGSALVGTVAYMSPEQARGEKVDHRADIFSFGIVLSMMLTGLSPFYKANPAAMLRAIQEGIPEVPSRLRPDLPAALDSIVLKALEKDRERRFPSMSALLGRLRALAESGSSGTPQAAGTGRAQPSAQLPARSAPLEVAWVLVMDLVGLSGKPMEAQRDALARLREVVRATPEYIGGEAAGGVMTLPSADGLTLVFSHDAQAPVRCAVQVQVALRAYPGLKVRIGIHSGPVLLNAGIAENSHIIGGGFDIAQRVMDCGDAGQILLSSQVADALDRTGEFGQCLSDLGKTPLLQGQVVHLYNLVTREAGNPETPSRIRERLDNPKDEAARPARPPRMGSEKASIGVMPFRSFSPEPDDQYLASGIASEIISALNGVPGLRVASQQASLGLNPEKVDAAEAAQRLKVRYLVTGHLRRGGQRIRLHAELIDSQTGAVAWTRHYDRTAGEIFQIQEDISKSIVGSLSGHLIRAVSNTRWNSAPENLDAWGLLRKAYCIWTYEFSVANVAESIGMLRRAVSLAPGYAAANAYLAHNLMQCAIFNIVPDREATRAEALALAEKACASAPEDPDTISCASSVFVHCGLYDIAVRHLKRALRVAPFDFVSWGFLGYAHAARGGPAEVAEAAAILTQLTQDAPDHPSVPYWLMFLSMAMLRLERFEEAAAHSRRAVEMQPAYVFNEVFLAESLARLGRENEAREALALIPRYNPRFTLEMFDEVAMCACRSEETLMQFSAHVRRLGGIPRVEAGRRTSATAV